MAVLTGFLVLAITIVYPQLFVGTIGGGEVTSTVNGQSPTGSDQPSKPNATSVSINSTSEFLAKVARPALQDPNLEIQLVHSGLEYATQIAFIGDDDMLVLQKNDGKVLRVKDCVLEDESVLDLTVANLVERGLLGIDIYNDTPEGKTFAFIYFTNAREEDGDDAVLENGAEGNRLFRFELVDGKLDNPEPLVYVSAQRGASHNGGNVLVGPDGNVYFTVGDIASHKTRAQNYLNGSTAEGTSSIIRVDRDGKSVGGILGRDPPLNQYYAYGIRNSYGMDFDPVTGKLWDTENGPEHSDEVNLVEPGFNSGWRTIMGFSNSTGFDEKKELVTCLYCSGLTGYLDRWINENVFGIREGRYSDPEFVWKVPIGVTAIKFMHSDKLGSDYLNDIFVADYVLGNIQKFELNENRDAILLENELADKIADDWKETKSVTFAQGFGAITDLDIGPDGYLYLISYGISSDIYRIAPAGTPAPCSA